MPVAWILSDYPIVAATAERLLTPHYVVEQFTWDAHPGSSAATPRLLLLDVTGIAESRVIDLLARLTAHVRVLVASLDRNEVEEYWNDPDSLTRTGEVSSLLALAV